MRNLYAIAALVLASTASAQQPAFFSQVRISQVVQSRGTAGTSASAALSTAPIGNLVSFKVCNDAVPGSSTYLFVGQNANPALDGVQLAPGACFVCDQCKATILSALNVKAQAASNGYSVLQYSGK